MSAPAPSSDQNPPEIQFHCAVFDTAFHPLADIMAVGLVSGKIELYSYTLESCDRVMTCSHHKESCRGLQFSQDGSQLYSISADRSIRAIDTSGAISWQILDAHSEPINAMKVLAGSVIVTGDDNGCIKIWDTRTQSSIVTFSDHEDFISDFAVDKSGITLLATSGDGRLSAINLKKGKVLAMSDQIEDELLSVEIIKDGKKAVVGTQEGVLNIYNWDEWGDLNDRMLGHPQSIDSIVKIDEDTIATGSSDGLIRLVQLLPNKFLGVVGEHGDDPIERIRLSRDKRFLASCSHDNTVKLWNVAYLFEEDGDVGGSFKAAGVDAPADVGTSADVDDAMSDDESDSDSDDSDSDAEAVAAASHTRGGAGGGERRGRPRGRGFFADL